MAYCCRQHAIAQLLIIHKAALLSATVASNKVASCMPRIISCTWVEETELSLDEVNCIHCKTHTPFLSPPPPPSPPPVTMPEGDQVCKGLGWAMLPVFDYQKKTSVGGKGDRVRLPLYDGTPRALFSLEHPSTGMSKKRACACIMSMYRIAGNFGNTNFCKSIKFLSEWNFCEIYFFEWAVECDDVWLYIFRVQKNVCETQIFAIFVSENRFAKICDR